MNRSKACVQLDRILRVFNSSTQSPFLFVDLRFSPLNRCAGDGSMIVIVYSWWFAVSKYHKTGFDGTPKFQEQLYTCNKIFAEQNRLFYTLGCHSQLIPTYIPPCFPDRHFYITTLMGVSLLTAAHVVRGVVITGDPMAEANMIVEWLRNEHYTSSGRECLKNATIPNCMPYPFDW